MRKWCRWAEAAQLGPLSGGHGVAEAVEPGAGVEVLSARGGVHQCGAVGVPHDEESERRITAELVHRPALLGRRFPVERRSVGPVVPETSGEPPHQRNAEIRMHEAIHRRRGPQPHETVERARPGCSGHEVAVQRQHSASADRELERVRREPYAQLLAPEGTAPAVVVAAHHGNGNQPSHPAKRRGHPKSLARNDATVREPELEKIAVDQQRVAQIRHPVEEGEQGRLGLARRVPEMGV